MQAPPQTDLLKRLFSEFSEPKSFEVFYQVGRDADSPARLYDILAALGIPRNDLSEIAHATLNSIEELTSEDNSDWLDFRWKLTAFVHVQDIFDVIIHESKDLRTWFQQYYFYYESCVILAESILSGLNGFYVASDALLRPFLEFTLLQNYYYRVSRKASTYSLIEEYFNRGKHPSWNTVLRNAIPDDSFCRPIRFRLQTNLAGLSESSTHPYHPDNSPVQHRKSEHGHSLVGLFFWEKTRFILDAALWAYYVNFPLLFHPVDVVRKFGYNSPVGIVVDKQCAEAVRHSLSADDYQAFKEYSEGHEGTTAVLEWVDSRPNLTDKEIQSTWNEKENGKWLGLWEGYCLQMAKLRATRKGMAFRQSQQKEPPDALLRDAASLAGWKRISRREKRRRN